MKKYNPFVQRSVVFSFGNDFGCRILWTQTNFLKQQKLMRYVPSKPSSMMIQTLFFFDDEFRARLKNKTPSYITNSVKEIINQTLKRTAVVLSQKTSSVRQDETILLLPRQLRSRLLSCEHVRNHRRENRRRATGRGVGGEGTKQKITTTIPKPSWKDQSRRFIRVVPGQGVWIQLSRSTMTFSGCATTEKERRDSRVLQNWKITTPRLTKHPKLEQNFTTKCQGDRGNRCRREISMGDTLNITFAR